ncbi:MAG: ABC transporter substrate-binding protein [Chloroflexota bacterium]
MSNKKEMNTGLSRRNFLKIFAAGAAGTVGTIALGPLAGLTGAQEPGVLRVAWDEIATLDPRAASGDSEIAFLTAIFDHLINTDAGSNLVPALATAWEVSEDGTQYTLTIRDDVTFHDGSALTIADILWTINWQIESEGTVTDLLGSVESFEEGDNNTLVITLAEPNPDFLFNLTDNKLVILKEGTEEVNDPTTFVGTGPFILEEYLPQNRATFVANENYWEGTPSVERLEFIFYPDTQAGIALVQGGQADAIFRLDNASFLGFTGDTNFTSTDIPTSGHRVIRLRSDREPGSNPLVREAFKLATDRQAIWDRVQLGFGAVGKDSPIGPAFGDFFLADAEVPSRDPEAAAALLAEAGFPDGIDIVLHGPNTSEFPDLAASIVAQWEEAGIRAELNLTPENIYYGNGDWTEVDLGITGWGARPTAQTYLDLAYQTGAAFNESHYSNPEMDELIDRARTTIDPEERVEIYHEIQRLFLEDGPVIVPYFFAQYMVTAANVAGIDLHPFAGRTRFNTATVS